MVQRLGLALILSLLYSCETPAVYNILTSAEIVTDIRNVPPSSSCQFGGVVVNIGVDENKNGLLDTSEITHTQTVCKDKTENIISSKPEPAGKNCQNGGVFITIGTDVNNDGIIQNNEIDVQKYICHQPEIKENIVDIINISGNICSTLRLEVVNKTEKTTKINLAKSENISIIAYKEMSDPYAEPVMQKEAEFPIILEKNEKKTLNLKMQRKKEGEESVFYSVYAENSGGSQTANIQKKCEAEDSTVTNILDILGANDIFLTSYYNDPEKNRKCAAMQPCFLGLPYGIKKGLFPLNIKINWGDGNEDEIAVNNLSYLPITQHTFNTGGNFTVTIHIKTKNSNYYTTTVVVNEK